MFWGIFKTYQITTIPEADKSHKISPSGHLNTQTQKLLLHNTIHTDMSIEAQHGNIGNALSTASDATRPSRAEVRREMK